RAPPSPSSPYTALFRSVEFVEQPGELGAASFLVGLDHLEHAHDVLLDRHAAEDAGFLGQVAEAEDRPPVHRKICDIDTVHQDAAAVGPHQTHDRVEAGGLAGAVG